MTLRALTTALGFAALLSLATVARAQEPAKPVPVEPQTKKAEPANTAKKAEPADDTKKAEPAKVEPKLERAYFAGGCFWCLEAFYERVNGVKQVVSGYAGGDVAKPSYEAVCTGLTGHAEVVGVEYDANIVSYDDLLDIFWICHDPTTLNRQGPDEGTQYRSAIFYVDDDQKAKAFKSFQKATSAGLYRNPIVTQLVPLEKFWPAEKYHQDYFRRNPKQSYCQTVIAPKIAELRAKLNAKAQPKK